jgi:hypothetical protein
VDQPWRTADDEDLSEEDEGFLLFFDDGNRKILK